MRGVIDGGLGQLGEGSGMTPDRWQQISQIFHAALTRSAGDRAGFLREACAGDDGLHQEVASLLANESHAAGFLSEPAFAAAAGIGTDPGGTLLTGRRIGVYQIQTLLGEGGMGEVYRARDTKLGREVAIKILPRVFTSDPERIARFEREARVLASVNHPSIGGIYGLEEADGVKALVLELVEGEDLSQRIARGPLSVEEALPMAKQIADALEAAHDKGVIHRDLKPANVMVTHSGVVKVLDFGLAAVAQGPGSPEIDATQSPTVTMAGTRAGVILGTAAYMSPEQAAGKATDRRSDVWSFGVMLWEMGSTHAAELSHVFGTLDRGVRGVGPRATASEVDMRVSEVMQQYWTNFAKTGSPNGGQLPEWPRFDPSSRAYIEFTDAGPVAKEGLRRPYCNLFIENVTRLMAN